MHPEVHDDKSRAMKEKIKGAESFEDGLAMWKKSLEKQVKADGFQQAWVDHWRALKTLHKQHVQTKHDQEKRDAKDTVYQALNSVAAMHMKLHAAPSGKAPAAGALSAATTSSAPGAGPEASPSPKAKAKKDGKNGIAATATPPTAGASPALGRAISPSIKDAVAAVASTMTPEEVKSSLKDVVEFDGKPVEYLLNEKFMNWGETVHNKPLVTFVPKTRKGVQSLVRWSIAHQKRVRCSGYRHTWTDLYSETDQVLVSMLPLDQATHIPVLKSVPIKPYEDSLYGVTIKKTWDENGVKHCAARIGASTTNDQFRMWCLDKTQDGGNWNWTIPLNVIMVEITWGGSNAPICHGAGIKNKTLSDLVLEIEFVNPKGEFQTVSDPELLKAAAGAFGLFGVVTAVTLKLDQMTYANMVPQKIPTVLTIPPPAGVKVPSDLTKKVKPTDAQLKKAWADFVAHVEQDYYSEWFWFPFQEECWVNCWKNDGKKENAKTISDWSVLSQNIQGMLGNAFNVTLGSLSPWLQTWLLSWSAMTVLPTATPEKPATVPLIEALHFRRGIQNMRVVDMELEIPIPAGPDGKPDWTICQKAWWAVISATYNHRDKNQYPLRVALEMRIMADSNIYMAPQRGNTLGTCSIEILTTPQTEESLWHSFMQEIADIWNSYTDLDGVRLNTRSHWAKQWQELQIGGKKAAEFYRTEVYPRPIHEFRKTARKIAASAGYKLRHMQRTFSNSLLDDMFFHKETHPESQ